jgi:DNA replication and repair protein RecF
VNVFIGANGQGKTNLLEAVAMLALSASPRARREVELVGPVTAASRIHAEVQSGGASVELSISLTVDGDRARRVIEVDGARKRAFDLPGIFRVTLFWPDDLGLVKAGPEQRRRFLNQMLVQVQQVSEEISAARAGAVRDLQPEAARCHAEIAAGERLEIHYQGPPDDMVAAVHNSLAQDLRRGSTSIGPHRDDLHVLIDGQDARAYASQGQQRTAVVSLKLAEAALVARRTGERPVLLLDDVLSELDGERRAALLRQVGAEGQVIITSVEAGPFPPDLISNAMVWSVVGGKIQACG